MKHLLLIRLIARHARRAQARPNGTLFRLLGQWLCDGATFSLLHMVVSKYRSLAGWDGNQVLFLYAFHLFSFSLSATFCHGLCASLPQKIHTGEWDQALLKPISPLLYTMLQEIRVFFLWRTPVALLAMCLSCGGMNIIVSPVSVLLLLIMLVSALMSQAALFIAASSFSFLGRKNPFFAVLSALGELTKYPLQIYGAATQVLLTFLIPLGFASFYPASAMVNVVSPTALPRFLPHLAPLVAALLLFCSVRLFHRMSARYHSARRPSSATVAKKADKPISLGG